MWLYRRGDEQEARDALKRAIEMLPDEPSRWIDLGRCLGRIGWTEESATVLAQARSLCERRLSIAADDDEAAAALAELLPDAERIGDWTVLKPDIMTAAGGATLARLADGSVLASGRNPVIDTYTVEARADLTGITGLRLEVLLDPSLPKGGAGRSPDGHFHLTSLRLSTVARSSDPIPIDLTRARADYWSPTFAGAVGAIDADPISYWSTWPRVGRYHMAVFQAAQPLGPIPAMRLRVELVSGVDKAPSHTLGRFRLSVTDRPFPLFEPTLLSIKADAQRSGLLRLGAAHYLLGDWRKLPPC